MKEIKLTKGFIALVDDEDFERVSKHSWYASGGYAASCASKYRRSDGKVRIITLHRFVMGLDYGDPKVVDHKDRDGLNCQKNNLRICNSLKNSHNFPKSSRGTSSKFKGVRRGKWYAAIKVNGKNIHLGVFSKEVDAAKAYDRAATKHFGEFARTNKMMGLYVED